MRNTVSFIILCLLAVAFSLAGCSHKGRGANSSGYTDAVEIKLKCRELADQMLATMPNDAIQGLVAMPTSFVDQNNTSRTSPLGRLMSEAMFYEFNQRGFPTREYRLTGNISVSGGRDDIALVPDAIVGTQQKWGALLVGTYYVEKDATFVNVRLVRATDGLVLRTGQLVLVNTPIVLRMAKSDPPASRPSATATNSTKDAGTRSQRSRNCLYAPIFSSADTLGYGTIPIRQGK